MTLTLHYKDNGKDQEAEVLTGSFFIGRDDKNDLVLPDKSVSREHAILTQSIRGDGLIYIVHQGLNTVTEVNGNPIHEKTQIKSGDLIQIGCYSLELSLGDETVVASFPPKNQKSNSANDVESGSKNKGVSKHVSTRAAVDKKPSVKHRFQLVGVLGTLKGFTLDGEGDVVTVGRAPDNEIVVPDDSVSSHHFKITCDANGYLITDLNSANGTYVNRSGSKAEYIKKGDQIRFGETTYVFKTASNWKPRLIAGAVCGVLFLGLLIFFIFSLLGGGERVVEPAEFPLPPGKSNEELNFSSPTVTPNHQLQAPVPAAPTAIPPPVVPLEVQQQPTAVPIPAATPVPILTPVPTPTPLPLPTATPLPLPTVTPVPTALPAAPTPSVPASIPAAETENSSPTPKFDPTKEIKLDEPIPYKSL